MTIWPKRFIVCTGGCAAVQDPTMVTQPWTAPMLLELRVTLVHSIDGYLGPGKGFGYSWRLG